MREPDFLTLNDVLRAHEEQIRRYGGSPGVRDMGLLESALAQPRSGFGGVYVHGDLAAMAAAYLYHIVRNHPFVDGNKRTGSFAALLFLDLNGAYPRVDEKGLGDLTLAVAEGTAAKEQVAQYFRDHANP